MQLKEAQKIRKQWGDKPCTLENHSLEKEYYLGSDTGDYVCTICGRSFPDKDLKPENGK